MGFFSRFKGGQKEDQDDADGDTGSDLPNSDDSVNPPHGEASDMLKGDGGGDSSSDGSADDAVGASNTDAISGAEEHDADDKRQLHEPLQAGGADKADASGPAGRTDGGSDYGSDGSSGSSNDHDTNDNDNDGDGGEGKPSPAAESARDDEPAAGTNSAHPGALDARPADKSELGDAAAQESKMPPEHESELRQQIRNEEDIAQRIQKVKEEYGVSVKSLMETKRELNQRRDEMSATKASLERLRAEVDEKRKLRTKIEAETAEKKKELARAQTQVEEALLSHGELEKKISEGQHTLSVIKTQQAETERELEEINARLYNAREELSKQEQFPEPGALSSTERAFIQGGTESAAGQETPGAAPGQDAPQSQQGGESRRYAGVVEAASVVVASLKSKLGMMQKELEAAQLMLEQERARHEATKRKLESLMSRDSPDK